MNDDLRWPRVYGWIRNAEGGWLDHPKDPGGATYAGVSLRAVVGLDTDADGNLDFDLDQDGDVDREDLLLLLKRDREGDVDARHLIEGFYFERYWKRSRASELSWPLCLYLVDAAIHHGPGPAVVLLQRGLGVKADGVVGPKTLGAAALASPYRTRRVLAHRAVLMHQICARRGDDFALGWFQRIVDLEAEGLREAA